VRHYQAKKNTQWISLLDLSRLDGNYLDIAIFPKFLYPAFTEVQITYDICSRGLELKPSIGAGY